MKRFLSIMVVVFAASLSSCDQATRYQQHEAKQALWNLEHEWAGAVQHSDVEALNRILAAEYESTGPHGEVRTKSQVIEFIKSGDLKISSFGLIDVKVQQYGTAALVSFRATWNGTSRRIDLSAPFRVTDVFVTRDGRWQCVSRHVTRIQSPATEEKTP